MLSFAELKSLTKGDAGGLKKVKLAIVADSASQFLNMALKGYGRSVGLDLEIYEADYNQISAEVFNPESGLYAFRPEYVCIFRSTERLLKHFYKVDKGARPTFAEEEAQYTASLYATIKEHLKAKVIINSFPEIDDSVFGNFANKNSYSFPFQLRKLNYLLMERATVDLDLFINDIDALQGRLGRQFVFDSKMYITADMPYSLDFLPHIAKNVLDIVRSASGSFKKCAILDLDNTMWGGIIGDDGIEGIQIGDLGIGKAFTEFQLWLKQLKERGIILAVCSKNTDHIAREPFERHPDMVLHLDDIALFVANWETKVDNIMYIRNILNIGFDSMVFLDDNPFERGMVRNGIPDITVPELPEDPAEYLEYLRSLNLFETASISEEDGERTKLYQEESKRVQLQQKFTDEAEYLKHLEMVSEVRPFDGFNAPRVSQLTLRSNQFNLRTVRYSLEEILEIAKAPDYLTLTFTLSDKFGAHGLICVVILKEVEPGVLLIDTWIMSCRVLKRGMERFTLNTILAAAMAKGAHTVLGEYLPTKKNGIVANHYRDLGFSQREDGLWVLQVADAAITENFITAK
jgi:FkbH-like protein